MATVGVKGLKIQAENASLTLHIRLWRGLQLASLSSWALLAFSDGDQSATFWQSSAVC